MIIPLEQVNFLPDCIEPDSLSAVGAIRNKQDDTFERFYYNCKAASMKIFEYKQVFYVMLFSTTSGAFAGKNTKYEVVTNAKLLTNNKIASYPSKPATHSYEPDGSKMSDLGDNICKIGTLNQFNKFIQLNAKRLGHYTESHSWPNITDKESTIIYNRCVQYADILSKRYTI